MKEVIATSIFIFVHALCLLRLYYLKYDLFGNHSIRWWNDCGFCICYEILRKFLWSSYDVLGNLILIFIAFFILMISLLVEEGIEITHCVCARVLILLLLCWYPNILWICYHCILGWVCVFINMSFLSHFVMTSVESGVIIASLAFFQILLIWMLFPLWLWKFFMVRWVSCKEQIVEYIFSNLIS